MQRFLILTGPSGCGKNTFIKTLIGKYPDKFEFVVSHTTRNSRDKETNGEDYHFVTRNNMENLIQENKFLEHNEFCENLYGTSFDAIEKVKLSGKCAVLDLNREGVESIKKIKSENMVVIVVILSPTQDISKGRLRNRATETENEIKVRLERNEIDKEYFEDKKLFDKTIINDNFDESFEKFERFIFGNQKLSL